MIAINVLIGKNPFDATYQDKSFDSEEKAIEWIMRNHQIIWCINGKNMYGQKPTHFEAVDLIRGN